MATYRKRGDSYQLRYSDGYDARGNRKEVTKTWKPDKNMTPRQIEKELQRQLVLFDEACKHGYTASAVKFETIAEEWLVEYAEPNLRSTTYSRMKMLRKRVYAEIGHLRIDKITTRDIQKFISSLSKDGVNQKTGGPLSPKSVRHYLSYISDIYEYAIRMGAVSDNPCRNVIPPKLKSVEKQIYSQEELALLLTKMEDSPIKYRVFFLLAAYSGLRRGEMLGLEWKDIDFDSGVINVHRTSSYTSEKGIHTAETKTKNSRRALKISSFIIGMLLELKAEQESDAVKYGSLWVETDRLFTKWNGEPMNLQTPYGWLKEFCEENNLPFHGIHSFRHFAASALISAGLDITTVSRALGHENSTTTVNLPKGHTPQSSHNSILNSKRRLFGISGSRLLLAWIKIYLRWTITTNCMRYIYFDYPAGG